MLSEIFMNILQVIPICINTSRCTQCSATVCVDVCALDCSVMQCQFVMLRSQIMDLFH